MWIKSWQSSNPQPSLQLTGKDNVVNQTESVQRPAPLIQLIEPLTDRELDVLRLMATGALNAAIAGQLVVSVGTIKTHLKHMYGKLAVQSRTQAVAQARSSAYYNSRLIAKSVVSSPCLF